MQTDSPTRKGVHTYGIPFTSQDLEEIRQCAALLQAKLGINKISRADVLRRGVRLLLKQLIENKIKG
jgi:hypothetical protein